MSCPRRQCIDWAGKLSATRGGRKRRVGHTLVEILLALGLSLVILVAVYAALDQHWRYAEAGQQQAERMQVTRALFETLSLDLRSVKFRPDDGVAVRGDANTLAIQSSGLPRAIGESMKGQKLVRWRMDELPARSSATQAKTRLRDGSRADPGSAVGLVRVAGNATEVVGNNRSGAVKPSEVLAAEVESIQFRYFAGGRWFEQWDSVARQSLPQAVEMTLGFAPSAAARSFDGKQTRPGEYKLVVPIPASEA